MKKFIFYLVTPIFLLLFVSFFIQFNKIFGASMEPTINNRKTVFVLKYFPAMPNPSRGEIVIYKRGDEISIGRVVGLPKESIRIQNGNLYLDDNSKVYRVEEEYLAKGTQTRAIDEGHWVKLGLYQYFVTGDNRSEKAISIYEGIVSRNDLIGKVLFSF